jgi:hypothetical protein
VITTGRLHAERLPGDYRCRVYAAVFGGSFGHLCMLCAILTLITQRMQQESVDPEDRQAIRTINQEMDRYTGHLRDDR